MSSLQKIICITGPSCSGKTELAFLLAEQLGSEIISADSRQIYKELTIGTAKPPDEYLRKIKHHFINHISIYEDYDASRFAKEAGIIINKLTEKNILPVVAGGTAFYFNTLLYGLFEIPDKDINLRKNLENELMTSGLDSLVNKLKEIDPATYNKIDLKNPRRVIRALEICYSSDKKLSDLIASQKKEIKYDAIIYYLNWHRDTLYKRINQRVDFMINSGLIEEVKHILRTYPDANPNALNTVGYKEIINYLNGVYALDKAIDMIKQNTRRYAKRQITFFKSFQNKICLELEENINLQTIVKKIIYDINHRE